jgi:predicted TPR repeat methyltransferase
MSYEVSRKFWTSQITYPDYPHLLNRRLVDLNFLINYIGDSKSVLDLGCATCSMLILLRELTSIKKFYGIDISNKMMQYDAGLILKVVDLSQVTSLPEADLTYCFGMFLYIFKDEHLVNILSNITSKVFLVRSPCTQKENIEYINKYSEELKDNYSAIYRTVEDYEKLLSIFFNVTDVMRSYPDEIESKYNTKHYYFVCKRS